MFELNDGYIDKKTELFGRIHALVYGFLIGLLNYQSDHVRSIRSNSNSKEQYLQSVGRSFLLKCFYPFFTGA